MEITVHFNNLEASDPIRNYVLTKVGKLKKYFDETTAVQVNLSVEKLNHIVKVNLNAHGYMVHVEEKDTNLYSAIDFVSDVLERKIKKYIEKLKRKKNRVSTKSGVVTEEVFAPETAELNVKKVIKVRNYEIKPMDLDEAAMQMDLLNRDFLVFINHESDAVNVVFRRKDGNYGLIEAKTK